MTETTLERPNESVMGQYVRTHVPRTNLNSVVHSLLPSTPGFLSSILLEQQKQFPDVSFWQGKINWDKMASKTDTVIIRLGQNLWEDKQFRTNYSEAKKRGMRRGVYFFHDDRVDPGRQAKLVTDLLKDDLPEMKIYADWETNFGGPFGGIKNVVSFMQAIEQKLSVHTGMYTGYWFFRENSNPLLHKSQLAYLKEKELWEAFYGKMSSVLVPFPWPFLTHWQYGTPDVGPEYGTDTEDLDMNYANMTPVEFNRRYPIKSAPPPIEPPAPPPIKLPDDPSQPEVEVSLWDAEVLPFKKLRVRTYPSIDETTLTHEYVTDNETFKGRLWSGKDYVWIKIDQSVRPNLIDKWVAVRSSDGSQKFIALKSQAQESDTILIHVRVVWDDENPDYHFKCRTQSPGFQGPDNPPAVLRFYPHPIEKEGDFRINMTDWKQEIIRINDGKIQKWRYLIGRKRATYNTQGWPRQAYITFSGATLLGVFEGNWFKFKTLMPDEIAKAHSMTPQSHPEYIHSFTCVTWDHQNKNTKRIPNTGTRQGNVYFFLVTNEGWGYIPKRHILQI